jgi:CRP/FNR family nitrogen fixation transcriptional regulator
MQARLAPRPDTNRSAPPREGVNVIGVARTLGRGQTVCSEGEPAAHVYKLVSGAVRSLRLLGDGRRQIIDFYFAGDVFGVEIGADYRATAETLGEAVLIVARRATIAADPDSGARLWRHADTELRRSQDHAFSLGRRSAAERIARFLLDLSRRLEAGPRLTLPMSRQDIADHLGLTIETVSRTLGQLQADGLIEVGGCRQLCLTRPAALAQLCE